MRTYDQGRTAVEEAWQTLRVPDPSSQPDPALGSLGSLERAFMETLWAAPAPVSAREVQAQHVDRTLAYATVRTVLNRLAGKGLVARSRQDRAWLYEAAASREAFVADVMMQALELTRDRGAALVQFAKSVTEEEAESLRAALNWRPDPGPGESR